MIVRYIFETIDFKHNDHFGVSTGIDELSSGLAYGSLHKDGNGWGKGPIGMGNSCGDGFGNGFEETIETGSERHSQ